MNSLVSLVCIICCLTLLFVVCYMKYLFELLLNVSLFIKKQKKTKPQKNKNTMRKHFGFWISVRHKACKMHINAHFNLSVFYSNFICSVMILASLWMMDGRSLQVLPVLTLLCLLMRVCGPGALMHPIGTQIEYTCTNNQKVNFGKLFYP